MWPTAAAVGENTSNMRFVAPAGATSASSKNWARTRAVLVSPLRGLSNTVGPCPHGSEGVEKSTGAVIPGGARNLALVRNLFQW
jgi:hypothetical protein